MNTLGRARFGVRGKVDLPGMGNGSACIGAFVVFHYGAWKNLIVVVIFDVAAFTASCNSAAMAAHRSGFQYRHALMIPVHFSGVVDSRWCRIA